MAVRRCRVANDIKSLSDAVMEPITKAYRIGGFGLAFLLLGALLMLTATFVTASSLSYSLVFVGFILVVLPCYFFYVKEIRPISRAQRAVGQSTEMIDAVQETAISMTELALELQALAFKHADKVATALDAVRPQIRAIPVIGKVADHPMLTGADTLSKAIVSTTENVREVVTDIQTALVSSDPRGLRKYLRELDKLKVQVKNLLAGGIINSES
jgi:ABC-type multidrug transport system fused ATPase/permease subunit